MLLKEDCVLMVGDNVEIISSEDEILKEYIGERGRIKRRNRHMKLSFSVYIKESIHSGKHVGWFSNKDLKRID